MSTVIQFRLLYSFDCYTVSTVTQFRLLHSSTVIQFRLLYSFDCYTVSNVIQIWQLHVKQSSLPWCKFQTSINVKLMSYIFCWINKWIISHKNNSSNNTHIDMASEEAHNIPTCIGRISPLACYCCTSMCRPNYSLAIRCPIHCSCMGYSLEIIRGNKLYCLTEWNNVWEKGCTFLFMITMITIAVRIVILFN